MRVCLGGWSIWWCCGQCWLGTPGVGSADDAAWRLLTLRQNILHEIGQLTMRNFDDYARFMSLQPWQRGQAFIDAWGILGTISRMSRSLGYKTLDTGVTAVQRAIVYNIGEVTVGAGISSIIRVIAWRSDTSTTKPLPSE